MYHCVVFCSMYVCMWSTKIYLRVNTLNYIGPPYKKKQIDFYDTKVKALNEIIKTDIFIVYRMKKGDVIILFFSSYLFIYFDNIHFIFGHTMYGSNWVAALKKKRIVTCNMYLHSKKNFYYTQYAHNVSEERSLSFGN